MIDVLIMGGTGFPQGEGITETFGRALDRRRFRYSFIDYPADYGTPTPYGDSVQIGIHALLSAIYASPNPVLLAGYSQGAGIAAQVAHKLSRGERNDLQVLGAALIACPLRPPGPTVLGGDPGGHGVSGSLVVEGIPVWHAAARRDPIAALPQGSALRFIADVTEYWSAIDPTRLERWFEKLDARARERRWQRWWSPETWRDTADVIGQASAYLVEGRHTMAYIREGHCAALAETVNREIGGQV
ncbi:MULTISPECIES: alpha/beta fold hydrolase [Nocardia]|uniref:alpha/beta fold hydrolase n=1 Tax=Nocardia TaxID=1817 RepID=UPI000D69C6EB|nr:MULTISPECIES: alpha/beta fold hydrolase [Nocardia]